MTEDSREIVVSLDFRKLFALSLLTIITLVSVYTYVVALLAWNAPTQELSVGFNDFWTTDIYGTQDAVFAPGDLLDVYVEADLASDYWWISNYYSFGGADISYRIILTIFDPDGAPILCESIYDTQPAGTTQGYYLEVDMMGSFFQIPSDAAASTDYVVKVVYWTDWLPSGVAKAVAAQEYPFEVT